MLSHRWTRHTRATTLLRALLALLLVELSIWGHISDKKITQECGLIDLEFGDVVMVDRGFDIQHLFQKCNLEHNTFLVRKRAAVT